jgi:tryptophan synthase alpha chain
VTKTLVIYLMAGADTPDLATAAEAGGADLIGIGLPFSDPLADGPVIRRAAERALVPMTYSSILEAYGWDRFSEDARAAGAASLIVADLPAGERPGLRRVQLVVPTSTDERVALAAAETDGWLYLVTVTGTTGARSGLSPTLAGLVERARRATDKPLYAGFGISTPDHARAVAALADGIVVGSRALEVAEDGPAALERYVRSLKDAL